MKNVLKLVVEGIIIISIWLYGIMNVTASVSKLARIKKCDDLD